MISFIKKHLMSQTDMPTNVTYLVLNLILAALIALLGIIAKIYLWLIILSCCLFLVRALFSLYCILKYKKREE